MTEYDERDVEFKRCLRDEVDDELRNCEFVLKDQEEAERRGIGPDSTVLADVERRMAAAMDLADQLTAEHGNAAKPERGKASQKKDRVAALKDTVADCRGVVEAVAEGIPVP